MKTHIKHCFKSIKPALILPIILLSNMVDGKSLDTINSHEGYPYDLLIKRSEQVKLIYKGKDKITCHVEVKTKQQTWKGEVYSTKAERFNQSPLATCMDRDLAKSILKSTF